MFWYRLCNRYDAPERLPGVIVSTEILHLITDEDGKVITASDAALRRLSGRVGVRCRHMVDARRADGSRICRGNCVKDLDYVGQRDHSAVHAKGSSYRLVCTAAGSMRVITLIPVDDQAVSLATLTSREREVLSLVAKGYTNPRIATTLELSASTVRTHMEHILAKLGVQTRAAAAARAIAAGLIPG